MIHHLDQFADATGKRIAVVGAGAVGLDVIEYFSARGASAVLIEMQDAPGRDLDIITKNAMLTMLDEHHVEQHMRTQLVAVTRRISPLKTRMAPSTFLSITASSAWECAPTPPVSLRLNNGPEPIT